MPIRTFSLNSPEAYEAMREPRVRPWIPAGSLPSTPVWPRKDEPVWVQADSEDEADDAMRAWLWHLGEGRMGGRG